MTLQPGTQLAQYELLGPIDFDISPDGERFLISVPTGKGVTASPYKVVLNWTASLK